MGGASHVVVGIVGELENVGRKKGFLLRGIAILCRVLEENGIRVAGDVFMGVHGDQGGRVDCGIDVVSEKTLPEAGDQDVVRDLWEGGEVGDILELLMVGGALPICRHRGSCRPLAGLQLGKRGSWGRRVEEAEGGGDQHQNSLATKAEGGGNANHVVWCVRDCIFLHLPGPLYFHGCYFTGLTCSRNRQLSATQSQPPLTGLAPGYQID